MEIEYIDYKYNDNDILNFIIKHKEINKKYGFIAFSEKNAKIMTCAIWCNLLITVGVSAILCFVA